MNPDDLEIIDTAIEIVVSMLALRFLFAWDEKRMTDEQRERAWPASTRGMVVCSVLWFPLWLFGVPLHFIRTRRNLRGVTEGLVALTALFVVLEAVAFAVAFLGGAPDLGTG
jgi:hypothetical protein